MSVLPSGGGERLEVLRTSETPAMAPENLSVPELKEMPTGWHVGARRGGPYLRRTGKQREEASRKTFWATGDVAKGNRVGVSRLEEGKDAVGNDGLQVERRRAGGN